MAEGQTGEGEADSLRRIESERRTATLSLSRRRDAKLVL